MNRKLMFFALFLLIVSPACFALDQFNLPQADPGFAPPPVITPIEVFPTWTPFTPQLPAPTELPFTAAPSSTALPTFTSTATATATSTPTLLPTLTLLPTESAAIIEATATNTAEAPTEVAVETEEVPTEVAVETEAVPTEVANVIDTSIPDSQYSLNVWLQFADADFTQSDVLRTAQILTSRLQTAQLSGVVENVEGGVFRVRVNGTAEEIVPLVSQLGFLEFVDFSGLDESTRPPDGACIRTTAQIEQFGDLRICPALDEDSAPFLQANDAPFVTVMTGDGIEDAIAVPLSDDLSEISFTLTPEGDTVFSDFTGNHLGEQLAIVLDGEIISAPVIQARISGQGQLTGGFTQAEAFAIATILNTNALPRPVEVLAVNTFE